MSHIWARLSLDTWQWRTNSCGFFPSPCGTHQLKWSNHHVKKSIIGRIPFQSPNLAMLGCVFIRAKNSIQFAHILWFWNKYNLTFKVTILLNYRTGQIKASYFIGYRANIAMKNWNWSFLSGEYLFIIGSHPPLRKIYNTIFFNLESPNWSAIYNLIL